MTVWRRARLAWTVRVLVIALAALVLVLPWVRQATGLVVFDGIDALLGMQCHRFDNRVMSLGGVPMAVCSRCAGVYVGILLGAAMARPRWTPRTTVVVVLVACVLMILEVVLEWFEVVPVVHGVRLLTGAALSWPVSALAVRGLSRACCRSSWRRADRSLRRNASR